MRYVVGIAGAPGAGKSAIVHALARTMPDAAAVHMDHYQQITARPLAEVMHWMAQGADIDEFPIPQLPAHLERLKRGEPVSDRVSGCVLQPRRYILLETHFGRAHRATGRYIDLLVWIDTPLDLALARNVSKFLAPLIEAADVREAREAAAWTHTYLGQYMAHVWQLLRMQRERVAADADFVVHGAGSVEDIAARVRDHICERLP